MHYRVRFLPIRHLRSKKRAGAEMHPAIVSGIIIPETIMILYSGTSI